MLFEYIPGGKVVHKSIIVFLFISVLICSNSQADAGDQYLLPKIGIMSVDLNDADSLTSLGLLYGYGLSSRFVFEAELNSSISGGKYDRTLTTNTRLEGKYTVWTIAGYMAFRQPLTNVFYFKSKLGLLYEDVERDGIQTTSGSQIQPDDKTSTGLGFAGGLGLGIRLGTFILENEITIIDENIIFYSIGLNYTF